MFASIRRYRVEGSLQELARLAEGGLVPVFQQNPGFVAHYIVDGGDGHAASVSIFESREAAIGSSEQAAAWVRENASEFLPEDPQITAGEALVAVTR